MFMCVLFYLGQLSHFLSCFGAGVTNLNEPLAPSPLLRVRSWLYPFNGHFEQKAMRDEWVIYVADHPLLNRRCTRLPGCIRLRNDLYCVWCGVKLYSLTHHGIPSCVIRELMNMYTDQPVRVLWNCFVSAYFGVSDGVKQGGILSPVLLCLYRDISLLALMHYMLYRRALLMVHWFMQMMLFCLHLQLMQCASY